MIKHIKSFWWLIAGAVSIVIVIIVMQGILNPKEYSVMTVTLVNSDQIQADKSELFKNYLETVGYDKDDVITVDANPQVDVDAYDAVSVRSFQVLAAEFVSGKIDLFISDEAIFDKENENNGFSALSDVFSEDFLSGQEDRLWTSDGTGESSVGIVLSDTQLVTDGIYQKDQTVIAGIGSTSKNKKEAADLLCYILTGTSTLDADEIE